MKLKSFGCSHIFGTDLVDCPPNAKKNQFSKLTWPALVASHLQMEYECYAWPGCGNLYITEQILNQAAQDPALFVINWTYIDRFDYINPATNSKETVRPGNKDIVSDAYFRMIHSEYHDKLNSLIQIKLCIDTLTQRKIPFLMCYTDSLTLDTKWHSNSATLLLQSSIKPYLFDFDNQSFVAYSKENGHQISAQDHVSESGHAACADYVITTWCKQNKDVLAQQVLS